MASISPTSAVRSEARGKLRWLNARHAYPIALMAWRGYEAIESACALQSEFENVVNSNAKAQERYRRLMPQGTVSWSTGRRYHRAGLRVPTDAFIERTLHTSPLRKLRLSPSEIGRWIRAALQRDRLRLPELIGPALHRPEMLIRLGYDLLRRKPPAARLSDEAVLAAWCLTGLGSVAISEDRHCEICFRCCVPGLTLCSIHSQSKAVLAQTDRSRSAHSQAARLGKRVRNMLAWSRMTLAPLEFMDQGQQAFASLLWPPAGERLREWKILVAAALAKAPLVDQLLPANFHQLNNTCQQSILRATVDEDEWIADRWPLKLSFAHQWFEAERALVRQEDVGMSDVNQRRLGVIEQLRLEGWSLSDIALRLGISRSHLSHLVARRRRKHEH